MIVDGLNFIKTKHYFCSNLDRSTKIQWSKRLLLHSASETEEAMGRHHGQWQVISSSHYGALNFDSILPTWSRRHKKLTLLTCGDANGSHRVGSVGVVRLGFNGIEVFFRRCSDFEGMCRSFVVLPFCFSSDQLLQMVAENSNFVAT
jgi:hypothetical protein